MATLFEWGSRLWEILVRRARTTSQIESGSRSAPDQRVPIYPEVDGGDKHLTLIDSRTIPSTYERGPDLSYLTESADYYANLLVKSAAIFDGPRLPDHEISMHNNRYVMAQWGLIARGTAAVPFAVEMLTSKIPEVREAGAGILGAVGGDDQVAARILESLEAEYRRASMECRFETLDTLVLAVGQMKNKNSIPTLAILVRDTTLNGDSRWGAVEALGKLARKRFDKQPDAIEAATEWLDKKGY
jgi:hypothetical protein